MPEKISYGVSLSEDGDTVSLRIAMDTRSLSAVLDVADVDLLIDALTELRERMHGDGIPQPPATR
jgi:hypothetical protein